MENYPKNAGLSGVAAENSGERLTLRLFTDQCSQFPTRTCAQSEFNSTIFSYGRSPAALSRHRHQKTVTKPSQRPIPPEIFGTITAGRKQLCPSDHYKKVPQSKVHISGWSVLAAVAGNQSPEPQTRRCTTGEDESVGPVCY